MEDYTRMSLQELAVVAAAVELAKKAIEADFASLTRSERYALALQAGMRCEEYRTPRDGVTHRYAGVAELTIGGRRYRAIGHGPTGDAYSVDRDGYIEFVPI